MSSVALILLAFSLAIHGVLVVVANSGSRAEAAPPTEIPVEIIQEAPQTAPPPAKAAAKSTAEPAAKPAEKPAVASTPAKPPAPAPAGDERGDLARELAALEAEHAALEAERGPGPLRDSIGAVALPTAAADGEDGDPTSYQAMVFSSLARAKEAFPQTGRTGTAGVRFSVDAEGQLVEARIAVSSGSKALDDEALAIVRAAAPFPKPPAGADRVFSANVAYADVAR